MSPVAACAPASACLQSIQQPSSQSGPCPSPRLTATHTSSCSRSQNAEVGPQRSGSVVLSSQLKLQGGHLLLQVWHLRCTSPCCGRYEAWLTHGAGAVSLCISWPEGCQSCALYLHKLQLQHLGSQSDLCLGSNCLLDPLECSLCGLQLALEALCTQKSHALGSGLRGMHGLRQPNVMRQELL